MMNSFDFINLSKSFIEPLGETALESKSSIPVYLNGDYIGYDEEITSRTTQIEVKDYLKKCGFSNFNVKISDFDNGVHINTEKKEDFEHMKKNLIIILK